MEKKHQYRGLTKQEVEESRRLHGENVPRKLRYGANSWRNSKILLFVYY